MGILQAKPKWIDSIEDGQHKCDNCQYKTLSEEFLKIHCETYHIGHPSYILYMGCTGSIDGRNTLNDCVSSKWIDCTGGQTAYKDGNLETLGKELVDGARENNIKLYNIYRMYDPGLGLDFAPWWVQGGIDAGVFQEYQIPQDCLVQSDDESDDESNDIIDDVISESEESDQELKPENNSDQKEKGENHLENIKKDWDIKINL